MFNVRASLIAAESDMMGMGKILTLMCYDYNPVTRELKGWLTKQVAIDVSEDMGHDAELVAAQQISVVESRDASEMSCMDFLDLMGDYNKAGKLHSISQNDEGMSTNIKEKTDD